MYHAKKIIIIHSHEYRCKFDQGKAVMKILNPRISNISQGTTVAHIIDGHKILLYLHRNYFAYHPYSVDAASSAYYLFPSEN